MLGWDPAQRRISHVPSTKLPHPTRQIPASFAEITEVISNGTLLCKVVEALKAGTLVGWFKRPRTAAVAKANIEKGLEALRAMKGMSHRHLWKSAEVHKADRETIVGLLEDCHRCFDGLKPRSVFEGTIEPEPYLGKHAPPHGRSLLKSTLSPAAKQGASDLLCGDV